MLKSIDIEIGPRLEGSSPDRIFVTNSVLCLKQGGTSTSLRAGWLRNCSYFLRRQIEIVKPRVVVTMGADALKGMQHAFRHVLRRSLSEAVADPVGEELFPGTKILVVFHPANRGDRLLAEQRQDWQRIARALSRTT